MRRTSAGAECQQHFLAQRILELLELERGFALIAEDFEHGWTAFLRNFDARVLQMHDMHLQSLHEKVLAVTTIRTRQGQIGSSGNGRIAIVCVDCTRWIPGKAMKT